MQTGPGVGVGREDKFLRLDCEEVMVTTVMANTTKDLQILYELCIL